MQFARKKIYGTFNSVAKLYAISSYLHFKIAFIYCDTRFFLSDMLLIMNKKLFIF